MKNKIFRALVALAAMAVLVASGLITFLVSQDYFNETKKELAQEAHSPVQPLPIFVSLPFSCILRFTRFWAAVRRDRTRKAPGARIKIVIG